MLLNSRVLWSSTWVFLWCFVDLEAEIFRLMESYGLIVLILLSLFSANIEGKTSSDRITSSTCVGHAWKHPWRGVCQIHGRSQLFSWWQASSPVSRKWGVSLRRSTCQRGIYVCLAMYICSKSHAFDIPIWRTPYLIFSYSDHSISSASDSSEHS